VVRVPLVKVPFGGCRRAGGLQCFKKAQQEIYDESDYDLKQVRPLAVGEVAIMALVGYALLR
jgi:hypothetical protein